MLKKLLPATWWSRVIWIAVTYIVAADFLPTLLLVIINSVGYLPYSDRPGPGWQMPHLPTGQELGFFAGFALLLLTPTAIYALAFAAAGLALGFCRLPHWALRAISAPPAFLAAGVLMAGVGWYIAIAAVGPYIAAGCAVVWALFVFPALVPRMTRGLPMAARLALPIALGVGGTYLLLMPLLPDSALTNAKVEVIKKDAAGTELSNLDLSYVGPAIGQQAKGPGKYVPLYWMKFTTDDRNQVRVLLVIDDDQPAPHVFVLPRTGDVIYRQSQGKWTQERTGGSSSKLSLELSPDPSGGVQVHIKGPCCSSLSEHFAPGR
ncbi:MAG TPA: hypothetical protein VLT16_10895 [Candidatus Limnocylindrales bacterium]|nr:hypothetical protein [Candidatus Limnocylindrales bacterium]